MASTGYKNDPRAVTSVEGRTGAIELDLDDVGGTAAIDDAVDAALGTQIGDAIDGHAEDTDPHGDRSFAVSAVSTHAGAADPHGDRAFATSAVSTHAGASDPHGDRAFATSAVSTHTGATDPHGDRAYTDSVASGKADLVGGFVPTAQIPAIAITEYLGAAANQAAMLALSGQKGDWCTRTDLGTTWVITGTDPTQLGSWTALSYPTAPVLSVAGHTGVVTLAKGDVGLGNVDNTSDANKPISSATQTALDAKSATSHTHGVATGGTGLASVTAGSYLVGNGTGALTQRTVAETQTDLAISPFGAWTGVGLVANNLVEIVAAWSADVSGTYFDVGFRAAAGGKLEGSGRLNTTTNYTGGATIFTLPAALCPAKSLVLDVRIGGSGAAAAFLTITSGGVASLSASFTAGAGTWLQLDSIGSRRTVSGS